MKEREIEVPAGSVAVIGMAGQFPGARNVDGFWANLEQGLETISHFTHEELLRAGIAGSLLTDPHYVCAQGAVEGADLFDAEFFGFTPAEAAITAPEHRLLLECAWEALESAGYAMPGLRIGVFAGVGFNSYLLRNILSQKGPLRGAHSMQVLLGNEKDHVATRIAYKLDLRGPCITVQTACSTSLVAVHLACQSLINGECGMALAGGATISVPQSSGYLYQEGGILSPDGHCRAFDADAQGTVPGNGVAIVLLKRAEDALADRDVIYAFIRGTAVNNDGADKIGYTAPSVKGQAAVIAEALAVAGVDPGTIGYIETHGTGTALGDPIEIKALAQAYRSSISGWRCAIGTVKSNIGHLDAAAGVAGLIKAVSALKNHVIPASLHFRKANPEINFADTPFFVNTELLPWPAGEEPCRAAVSSFGIGGTNAHVILEEAPELESSATLRPYQLLVFSAKSEESLDAASDSFKQSLNQRCCPPADVAYTLQTGRRAFPYRRTVVCRDAETLTSWTQPESSIGPVQGPRPVVFLFPGQGAQYVDMGREIYQTEATFRSSVDYCADFLKSHLDVDLRLILYPDPACRAEADRQLDQTYITQPAMFVVEYALAMLWMEWGVQPVAMIGHSIGEYTAACIAGVFSLEDALTLVAIRGRLMYLLPRGAMLTVSLGAERLEKLIGSSVYVAADNSADSCVLSGSEEEIAKLEPELGRRGIRFRRLRTSHAFHSAMMDPILDAFKAEVTKTRRRPPRTPYISNLTGNWIEPEQAIDPEYWVRHLRQTVRFREGQQRLLETPYAMFLEVGPGQSLSTLLDLNAQQSLPPVEMAASMRHPRENASDAEHLMRTLGLLWRSGVAIDWRGYWKHETRNRVRLPTYRFQRQRYWIEAPQDRSLERESILDANASLEDTIERQLQRMVEQLEAMAGSPANFAEKVSRVEVALTAAQAWFFDLDLTEPNHFNHFLQLEFREPVDFEVIRRAFVAVAETHEALRTRYRMDLFGWHPVVEDLDQFIQKGIVFGTLAASDEASFIEARAIANESLNLGAGPLVRVSMFGSSDGLCQQLLLVCHHLLVDLFSWTTIVSDFELACTNLSRGQRVLLPPVSCSYGEWTTRLQRYARSGEARRELPYWLSDERRQAVDLPLDHNQGSNSEGPASQVEARLDVAETDALLAFAPKFYESPLCDIVLTALSAALINWAGGPVSVDIEGHGREDLFPDLDLSRIVGWLTAIYPLLLDVRDTVEPLRAIRRMRDKRLGVPLGGIGYGLLRYSSGDAGIVHSLSALRPAQISFNYEEQPRSGTGLLFAQSSLHSSVSPMNRRTHLLNVQAGVREKQFYISLGYSTQCHQRKTVEELGTEILDSLRRFVEYASQHHPVDVAPFSNCSGNNFQEDRL